jgi:hypothetical protein
MRLAFLERERSADVSPSAWGALNEANDSQGESRADAQAARDFVQSCRAFDGL